MVEDIFRDFEGETRFERANQLLMFFLGVLIFLVFTNVPDQEKNALIFMVMLLVWGFISVIETITSQKALEGLRVYGIGNINAFLVSIAVGAIFGFFVISFNLASVVPVFSAIDLQEAFGFDALVFLFVVVAAPLVEANFFRGLIFGAVSELLNLFVPMPFVNGVISLFVQAAIFAGFHAFIVAFNPASLVPHFVFGLVAGIGVVVFRSIGFEYGLHGMNNALVFFGGI